MMNFWGSGSANNKSGRFVLEQTRPKCFGCDREVWQNKCMHDELLGIGQCEQQKWTVCFGTDAAQMLLSRPRSLAEQMHACMHHACAARAIRERSHACTSCMHACTMHALLVPFGHAPMHAPRMRVHACILHTLHVPFCSAPMHAPCTRVQACASQAILSLSTASPYASRTYHVRSLLLPVPPPAPPVTPTDPGTLNTPRARRSNA